MSEMMGAEIKHWTAWRKSGWIVGIIKDKTTVAAPGGSQKSQHPCQERIRTDALGPAEMKAEGIATPMTRPCQ